MIKSLMIALSLSAALSAAPAFAATTGPELSSLSFQPIYTEANWQTLRIPVSRFGGVLPNNLTLSTSGLPVGTTVTLTGVEQDGGDAVLTLNVERADVSTAVNVNSTMTLSAGDRALISLNVPVIGTAISYTPSE